MSRRLGGIFGIAAVAVWVALYSTAAVAYPGYDVSRNHLSDLGHPNAPAAWAFNAACIFAGLMAVPFGLSTGRALGGRAGNLGAALLVFSAVALVLVGVFPEESPNNMHLIASLLFFVLLAASLAVLAVPMFRSTLFGPVAGVLAAVTSISSLTFIMTGGRPLLEHVAVYLALVWQLWTGRRLLG